MVVSSLLRARPFSGTVVPRELYRSATGASSFYFGPSDNCVGSRDKWPPATRETADHSLPYVLAVALTKGNIWLDDFTDERIREPGLHALMQKIEVYPAEEYTRVYPEANGFRLELTVRSGKKMVKEILYAKGHPKNPMTDKEIEAKFRRLAEPVMGARRIGPALERLWH